MEYICTKIKKKSATTTTKKMIVITIIYIVFHGAVRAVIESMPLKVTAGMKKYQHILNNVGHTYADSY